MIKYPCTIMKDGTKTEMTTLPKPAARGRRPEAFEVSFCPPISIQKLLYESPLYSSQKGSDLRILILADQKSERWPDFLDSALQLGQMKDTKLTFTVSVKDPEKARDNYLQKRPALRRFVDVAAGDEALPLYDRDKYGQIRFCDPTVLCGQKKGSSVTNKSGAEYIIKEGEYQYILSDLGTPEKNNKVVNLYTDLCGEQERYTVAAMPPVSENNHVQIPASLVYMAFCADLVWGGTMEVDMQEKLNAFLQDDPYRIASSLAFVLSLRYKLHSVGIDGTNEEMAEQFSQLIRMRGMDENGKPNEAEETLRILAALEHRRWVLEKVTDGWDAPLKEDGSLDLERIVALNDTKDKHHKLHPCIVRSTSDMPLSSEKYTENNHKEWRKTPSGLDELDAMSVKLYKLFYKKADAFRKQDPMNKNSDLMALHQLLDCCKDPVVEDSFRRYEFCLSNILSGSKKYAEMYSFYQNQLFCAAEALPETVRDEVKSRTKLIGNAFFAARESCLFHDFKGIDFKMILQIPFILTFRPIESMAVIFTDGAQTTNGQIFQNVASLTVLSPKRVHLLFWFSRNQKPELVRLRLKGMMRYLVNRPAPKEVTFNVACAPDVPEAAFTKLQECLAEVQKKYSNLLTCITLYHHVSVEDAAALLMQTARCHGTELMDCSTSLFGSPMTDYSLISGLKQSHTPYFTFDTIHRSFLCSKECRYLAYLHTETYLRTEDMFVLMGCRTETNYMPSRPERYKELWSIYTGEYLPKGDNTFKNGVKNWNQLAIMLENYLKEREDRIEVPSIPLAEDGASRSTQRHVLDYQMFELVRDEILPPLIRNGIISNASTVIINDQNQVVVTLQDVVSSAASSLNKLFTESIAKLAASEYPIYTIRREDKGKLQFHTVNLRIDNMKLIGEKNSDAEINKAKYCIKLLKSLKEKQFISDFKENNYEVSFSFCSPEIMKYVSQAGQILELHVFYKLLECGWFDDVVCGYQLNYQGVRNELDIVATKGFRSFIIECKAVSALSADYYYKLHSISQVFGINVQNILAGNLYRGESEGDQLHQQRGDTLGIISLTKREEILDIDEHLIRIASEI